MTSFKAEPATQAVLCTLSEIVLCDGYRLTYGGRLDEVVAFLEAAQPRHPGHRLLVTLDDLGQASYTAFRAIEAHDLDAEAETVCFDRPEQFPLRLARLHALAEGRRFSDLAERLFWIEPEDAEEYMVASLPCEVAPDAPESVAHEPDWDGDTANGLPDFFLMHRLAGLAPDDALLVQAVPVDHPADLVAAFPQTCWTDALTPMDLLVLARHLQDIHGYALIGIGATLAAFLRQAPPDAARAAACAADVVALYGQDAASFRDRIAKMLSKDRLLILPFQ